MVLWLRRNMSLFLGYLNYSGGKCHDVYTLLSNDSAKTKSYAQGLREKHTFMRQKDKERRKGGAEV